MKKFILCLSLICLTFSFNSCSNDDDDNNSQGSGGSSTINPPAWIIGTWKSPELGETHKFQFTKNNFIFTQLATVYNFAEIAKQDYYSVKETTNTSDIYQIEKTFSGAGVTAKDSFKFVKVSDNEVTFYMSGVGINPAPITLNRVN